MGTRKELKRAKKKYKQKKAARKKEAARIGWKQAYKQYTKGDKLPTIPSRTLEKAKKEFLKRYPSGKRHTSKGDSKRRPATKKKSVSKKPKQARNTQLKKSSKSGGGS